MYLKLLKINNFRSFGEVEISLCPDLTIFVGENNGGKSNAIDAIRLLTAPLSGRRELYCETTDIRFGSSSSRFDLQGILSELSPAQQGRLLSAAADPSLETAMFGLIYDESIGDFPFRPAVWAGHLKGVPEPGALQMVRHVYLPALRDAKRALASGNPTRIYALLRHFLGDADPDEVAKSLGRATSGQILSSVDVAVKSGLEALTAGVRRQSASLGFATNEKLIDIARDLRFKLADHGITPEDLRYSGHGYAGLLYMATIAVELEKVSNADLTLFLVEEPEAHLHPQLQAAVLSFLEEQAANSKNMRPSYDGPAGELQVVVATHSPNLSAWVEGKKLVVFRSLVEPERLPEAHPDAEPVHAPELFEADAVPGSKNTAEAGQSPVIAETSAEAQSEGTSETSVEADDAPQGQTAAEPPRVLQARRTTRCVALHALDLDPIAWRKIDRYLDVTKSALLFGGRVLLIEGIAEALLLPVIARTHVLKDKKNLQRLFRSAVFVPIDGVDFEPYIRLLLTAFANVRIADRVVVITDGDGGGLQEGQELPGKERKDKLEAIALELEAVDALDVFINTYSLEAELVRAGNGALLKSVYLELHPRSGANWDLAVATTDKSDDEQALAIQSFFKSTRKGDFAQILAEKISGGEEFKTPGYIADAIEALVR